MSNWTAAGLDRIGSAGELRLTTRRADGSLRPYVPVWVVRVGDELFVRSRQRPARCREAKVRAFINGHRC